MSRSAMTTVEPAEQEPLDPHPAVPGLSQCRLCGGVTQDRGVIAHHLAGCPWRIRQQLAAGGPAPGTDVDRLQRQLSAARGEASFHQARTVYLEQQLADLTARLSAFEINDDHLAYLAPDGHPCTVQVTCPQALRALGVLLGRQLAIPAQGGDPAPYHPAATSVVAGGAGNHEAP